MTLKNDEKFEEKLTYQFKTNMRNLANLDLSTRTSHKIGTLMGCLCCFSQKSTEEISFMKLETDLKFEEKLTCGLENDKKNVVNFHQSTQKSKNWDFYGILSSRVEDL